MIKEEEEQNESNHDDDDDDFEDDANPNDVYVDIEKEERERS